MQTMQDAIKDGIARGKSLIELYATLEGAVGKVDFYKSVLALIERGEISNVLLCYCGHDCSKCVVFRATLFDDADLRARAAKFSKDEFGLDIPAEKQRCLSARSDEIMEGCLQCPYMKCCKEKGLVACAACDQYPCEMLAWYEEKYVNKVNQIL